MSEPERNGARDTQRIAERPRDALRLFARHGHHGELASRTPTADDRLGDGLIVRGAGLRPDNTRDAERHASDEEGATNHRGGWRTLRA